MTTHTVTKVSLILGPNLVILNSLKLTHYYLTLDVLYKIHVLKYLQANKSFKFQDTTVELASDDLESADPLLCDCSLVSNQGNHPGTHFLNSFTTRLMNFCPAKA